MHIILSFITDVREKNIAFWEQEVSRLKTYERNYEFFGMLKFIAALLIAVFLHTNDHFFSVLGYENPFLQNGVFRIFSVGTNGLTELFFLLSGILFAHVSLPRIIQDKYSLDSFLKTKIFRLYPLVIITSIAVFLIELALYLTGNTLWGPGGGITDIVALLEDILFAGKVVLNLPSTYNGPIWYVNVLMFCYILGYFISMMYKKRSNKTWFVFPVVVFLSFYYADFGLPFINAGVSRGVYSFFTGCVLEFLLQKFITLNDKNRKQILIGCAAVLAISVLLILILGFEYKQFISDIKIYSVFLAYPALIILLFGCKPLNKLFDHSIIRYLGNISYGIYLWNFPILGVLYCIVIFCGITEAWFWSNWVLVLIMIIAIHMVVAIVSYNCFESKIAQKLKKKITINA